MQFHAIAKSNSFERSVMMHFLQQLNFVTRYVKMTTRSIKIVQTLETRTGKRCFFLENYKFRERVGMHVHESYDVRNIIREEVRAAVKRKADEESHVKPNKIIHREIKRNEKSSILSHKDFQLLRRSADQRRKQLPTLPTTIDEAIDQLKNMTDSFCTVYKGISIMTTADDLRMLFQGEYVFGDGTFEYCPRHFEQLYTIHVYIMGYIPIIFCFLRDKSGRTYIEMWEGI